jgi:hypothetical protein
MRHRYPFAVLLLAGFACKTEVSCGGGRKVILHDKLEAYLRGQAETFVDVKDVACPEGLSPVKGAIFQCTLTYADDTTQRIDVKQTSDEGDLETHFLPTSYTGARLAKTIATRSAPEGATVDCGTATKAISVGDTFECTLTSSNGSSSQILVTWQQDTARWELKP